jgi:hypothetical protein
VSGSLPALVGTRTMRLRPLLEADVAQLVEQLIRNQ